MIGLSAGITRGATRNHCVWTGLQRNPASSIASVLPPASEKPTFAQGNGGTCQSRYMGESAGPLRGDGARVFAELRPTVFTPGPTCRELGSSCVDLDESWSCRHGAPRCVSLWRSRAPPAPSSQHVWIPGSSLKSGKSGTCGTSQEMRNRDHLSRSRLDGQISVVVAFVVDISRALSSSSASSMSSSSSSMFRARRPGRLCRYCARSIVVVGVVHIAPFSSSSSSIFREKCRRGRRRHRACIVVVLAAAVGVDIPCHRLR